MYRFLLEGSYNLGIKVLASKNYKQQKHKCPTCSKKSFVRYVDVRTMAYLPCLYGKCDHESKCGYQLSPYIDGYALQIKNDEIEKGSSFPIQRISNIIVKRSATYMPEFIFKATLKNYKRNTFVENLRSKTAFPMAIDDINKVIALYYLGTVSKGYLSSGTTFPFIDINNNIRGIQVKTFDDRNHTLKTGNIHSILSRHYGDNKPPWLIEYLKNEGFFNCLFGEHLLSKHPSNVVALVEAPKTAIYGTLYFGFPDNSSNLLWLAVYNLSSLTYEKCKVLKGRDVILFPDLSKKGDAYSKWKEKAQYFNDVMPDTNFVVSDLLEKYASENDRFRGGDLADFLIQQDWRIFRNKDFNTYHKVAPEISALILKNPSVEYLIDKLDLTTTN